jgi:hypothetical protein
MFASDAVLILCHCSLWIGLTVFIPHINLSTNVDDMNGFVIESCMELSGRSIIMVQPSRVLTWETSTRHSTLLSS